MPVHTLQLVVDVPGDGKPISGHVGDGSAPPEPFRGWLGLLQVLDALLTDERRECAGDRDRPAADDRGLAGGRYPA
jgi:hypothetical protein